MGQASLDPLAGAEPWGTETRDDGFDRYLGRFRAQFVADLSVILQASGVSDVELLCRIIELNVRGRIRTDEDLVAYAVRKNLFLDASRFQAARRGDDPRETTRVSIEELRRRFGSAG